MRQLKQSKPYLAATGPPSIPPARGEVSSSPSQGEVGRGSNAAKIQPQTLKLTHMPSLPLANQAYLGKPMPRFNRLTNCLAKAMLESPIWRRYDRAIRNLRRALPHLRCRKKAKARSVSIRHIKS